MRGKCYEYMLFKQMNTVNKYLPSTLRDLKSLALKWLGIYCRILEVRKRASVAFMVLEGRGRSCLVKSQRTAASMMPFLFHFSSWGATTTAAVPPPTGSGTVGGIAHGRRSSFLDQWHDQQNHVAQLLLADSVSKSNSWMLIPHKNSANVKG